MTDAVRDSYSEMSELYASLVLGDLSAGKNDLTVNSNDVAWIETFAKRAAVHDGVVADLGCGPGHVVNHLCEMGLSAIGYDLSPGQIEQAKKAFPNRRCSVGDLTAIDHPNESLSGIVSRYSIIHMDPTRLGEAFREWVRVLEPGAPALVSFFGARSAEDHGTPFDHKVVTAYALYPETVAAQMKEAGFVETEVGAIPIPEGGRPFDQGNVLAHKSR